jgi:uncharacterized Tic20 family protein
MRSSSITSTARSVNSKTPPEHDETCGPKPPAGTAAGKLAALLPVASDAQHPQRPPAARQKKLPGSGFWRTGSTFRHTHTAGSPANAPTAQVVYNIIMNDEHPPPSNEERLLAALAHAGIILNGFNLIGIIGAITVLVSRQGHSEFVRRHTIQALAFQLTGLIATMLLLGTWLACLLISLIPALLRPELYREGPPMPFWLALGASLLILLFVLIGIAYGCVGALAAWRGQAFRYLLIGPLVEQYIGVDGCRPDVEASASAESKAADRGWLGE